MTRRHNRMPWRVLAHERGKERSRFSREDGGYPDGHEFDEIVLGDWLHVEQMDVAQYWLRLGQRTFWVTIDPKTGNAKSVKEDK